MQGFIIKAAAVTFVLFSIAFSPSLSFATNTDFAWNKNTKLGCMSCHQANVMQPVKTLKKHTTNVRHRHQALTVQND